MIFRGVKKILPASIRSFGSTEMIKTPLYDWHVSHGGKIVEFAGYALPIDFKGEGIIKEHLHTRNSASLFDVTHMGNIKIFGEERYNFIERLTVGDIKELPQGNTNLSLIMNATGGIVDDTMITNMGDHISMIVNGACKHKDWKHFNNILEGEFSGKDVKLEYHDDYALIAIQGPKAAQALQEVMDDVDLKELGFLTARMHNIKKIGGECMVSRCGYTGEDGFELKIPVDVAPKFADLITSIKDKEGNQLVKPAGLGARDTLRLESGLCLYGNDLWEEISPVEGLLVWTMGKRRKKEWGFLGWERVKSDKENGVKRKRCGFVTEGKAARPGADLYDEKGEKIVGKVTSGTHSPLLKQGIGMAYLDVPLNKAKTTVMMKVMNKFKPVVVKKMPFVPTRYYKKE